MPYERGSPHPEPSGDPHSQYATDTEFGVHATRHQSGGADAVAAESLTAQIARSAELVDPDPATPANGRLWYNATAARLKAAVAGAIRALMYEGQAAAGELAGTYPGPTVAATHSGSAHHAQSHGDADHTQTYEKTANKGVASGYASLDAGATIPDAQIPAAIARDSELHAQGHDHTAADASGVLTNDEHDGFGEYLEIMAPATPAANKLRLYAKDKVGVSELFYKNDAGTERDLSAAGGGVTFAAPSAAIDIGDAATEGVATTALRSDAQFAFTAPVAGYPVNVAAAEADGTATTPARSDHGHAHGVGYLPNAHHVQSHGAADHVGDVIPAAIQDFGAFYSDRQQIAAPASPAAGTRRLFVDSADGKLKVRTSAGVSVSLEEQGGGVTRISGSSGAAGADITWQRLTANSADVTTTALSAAVMTTTGLGAGTWKFKYTLIYQTAATGTGIGFGVNHTGTHGQFQAMWWHTTTGGAAATGVGDDVTATVAGQLVEGKHNGVKNVVIGSASAGVATANADILAILEGIIVVSVSGSLEFKIASEVSGSAVRIMADSLLELHKIA